MSILFACLAAFILDLIIGDPRWLYHPVRIIGNLISVTEKGLRRIFPKSDKALFVAGIILWITVTAVSLGSVYLILMLAEYIHPVAAFVLETFWCYQLLAMKALKQESMKVYDELHRGDIASARLAVSMIVGRDTKELNTEGITKATVETVAENTSDGITAPLFYMLIGGAPLAFFYKAVNTMDSMVGYKNDKYLYFGKFAAIMDDIFNYIPARITAILMIIAAFLGGMDGKQAIRIYRRDRKNHASPNAPQTEAVCAGALGIQLAGDAYYFGKLYKKPTLGDANRSIEPEDIIKSCRLMYITATLMLVTGGGLRLLLISIF